MKSWLEQVSTVSGPPSSSAEWEEGRARSDAEGHGKDGDSDEDEVTLCSSALPLLGQKT